MISRKTKDLMLCNARLKYHRDLASQNRSAEDLTAEALRQGRMEGRMAGRQEGRITLLQELLALRPTTAEKFAAYREAQLNALEEQLQQQLRSRR